MKELLVPIVVLGEFLLICLVIWIVSRRLEQRARIRAELHMKLLERFSTVRELEDFLQTDLGRRFMLAYAPPPRSPLARIAATAQVGVALGVLALGTLLVAAIAKEREVALIGLMVLSLGVALLAAAALGQRLVRSWGLGPERVDARALPHVS